MTGLHRLLVRSATAALEHQDPVSGAMPAGHNGPWGQRETPLRNTSHWLVTFCRADRASGDPRFREAARRAAAYLADPKARPGGASFEHRDAPPLDGCNGLIGQAWTLEALAEASEALEDESLAQLAEEVFLAHPYDPAVGLWRRLEVDGRVLGFDYTLNHQVWFAAAGAVLAPHAGLEVATRVAGFLDRLEENLDLYPWGCARHPLAPTTLWRSEPRNAWRLQRLRRSADLLHKATGYLAFNLYGLALLAGSTPNHPFWRSRNFRRLWSYARSDHFRRAVAWNGFGWPYNPTGIEMAFALDVFEPGSRSEQERWLGEQLSRHWNADASAMSHNSFDGTTLAARLYEATRLPDLALSGFDA